MCVSTGIALFNQCTASCFLCVEYLFYTVHFEFQDSLIQTDIWIQEKAWLIASAPKNTNAKNINSRVSCLVG